MSETYLVVIPHNPDAELPASAKDVKRLLCQLAGTDQARIKDYGKLQFIDCGEAFEHIACPTCETKLGIEQWHALMDQDWHGENGFHLLEHALPCCGATCTLDALSYVAPQGFSKWFISARALNRGPLTRSELNTLKQVAGIRLRAIIQQY